MIVTVLVVTISRIGQSQAQKPTRKNTWFLFSSPCKLAILPYTCGIRAIPLHKVEFHEIHNKVNVEVFGVCAWSHEIVIQLLLLACSTSYLQWLCSKPPSKLNGIVNNGPFTVITAELICPYLLFPSTRSTVTDRTLTVLEYSLNAMVPSTEAQL